VASDAARRAWRGFIIAASFVFYAGWDWRFCFLLAFSILWNQLFALAIHAREDARARKWLLAGALSGNLVLLAYFKYVGFFITSTNNLFAVVGIDVPVEARSVILPVGMALSTRQRNAAFRVSAGVLNARVSLGLVFSLAAMTSS